MKILRKIFGGLSLTAAMFVFQACYGTMESMDAGEVMEYVDSLEDEVADADDDVEEEVVMAETIDEE